MGRYSPYNNYEDPNDLPWWQKFIGVLLLGGLVEGILWLDKHWPF